MKHARDDYNRIQDPAGIIPEDEPVFLLRAKDIAAPAAIYQWVKTAELSGAAPEILQAARDQISRMYDWQKIHGVKVPDLSQSPALEAESGDAK